MKAILFFILVTFGTSIVMNAQSREFPNELKGYEFFGKGKLEDLRLGISVKENVEKIFGDTCIKTCIYDNDWNIKFHYLDNWTLTSADKKYKSAPQFAGKVWVIELIPKNIISFSDLSFTRAFHNSLGILIGDGMKATLKDSTGLSYIFESDLAQIDVKPNLKKLVAIRYDVSAQIDANAWILVPER